MKYAWTLLIALTALAGCDNKPQSKPAEVQPPQFIQQQQQQQALDKAKGVGDTLEKQAEEQKKQVDDATK